MGSSSFSSSSSSSSRLEEEEEEEEEMIENRMKAEKDRQMINDLSTVEINLRRASFEHLEVSDVLNTVIERQVKNSNGFLLFSVYFYHSFLLQLQSMLLLSLINTTPSTSTSIKSPFFNNINPSFSRISN